MCPRPLFSRREQRQCKRTTNGKLWKGDSRYSVEITWPSLFQSKMGAPGAVSSPPPLFPFLTHLLPPCPLPAAALRFALAPSPENAQRKCTYRSEGHLSFPHTLKADEFVYNDCSTRFGTRWPAEIDVYQNVQIVSDPPRHFDLLC